MNDLQVSKSLRVYADFKRKVLKVAQKNMMEKASIYFEFDELKKGRKVDELLFKIHKNPKFEKQEQHEQPALFENKPNIDEQLKALSGQKIYVQDKLFFFQNIRLKDGKYQIVVKDTNDKTAIIPTMHIEPEATIETIHELMKGE